jgi:IS5 family transposase
MQSRGVLATVDPIFEGFFMALLGSDSGRDAAESVRMIPLGPAERAVLEAVVPADDFLRRLLQVVDFEQFRPTLAACYHPTLGASEWDPVVLLKLEVLMHQYGHSDRSVMRNARVNLAYRLFLGLSLKSSLPHSTTMTYFRLRLGNERLQAIFDTLVRQARQLGLVKDRLRVKDATHIIANIAIPSTIGLIAQTRDRVLELLRPLAAERVAQEQERAQAITIATQDAKDEQRLLERVAHLRAILAWADEVPKQEIFRQQPEAVQQRLLTILTTAHKILADREHPKTRDKTLSVHDPDARRGMHGGYYEGFLEDVSMDPDSEIITAVNVLPANGDEAGDAVHLIKREEQAHGNNIEALSMDSVGFNGRMLRECTDSTGLNVEVFTPPRQEPPSKGFPAERFSLAVVASQPTLTCPAGQSTTARERNTYDTGYRYRFKEAQCSACALRAQCLDKANAKRRMVIKNDYEAEYAAARAKAKTPEFAAVRSRHTAIERKLSELINRHDIRHARYRGQTKVLFQSLMTCLVVNMKRLTRLLLGPPGVTALTVRAELVAGG